MTLRTIGARELEEALDIPGLIEALRAAFRAEAPEAIEAPLRHHHAIPAEGAGGSLLLMPAWRRGHAIGVKVVTVFADNGARGLPAVMATYLLLDAATGEPLAQIDGHMLTLRRTAAASALAATFLARPSAQRMVMVGTGQLAPHLIEAHAALRPIREVHIWGRDSAKALALARTINERLAVRAMPAGDLERAVREADIVSCATTASAPLVQGAWLAEGAHLDLVGGFRPDMREADDSAVTRARVYVDTREGAGKEAGDIVQPLANGTLAPAQIVGDLHELCRGTAHGRTNAGEITLFKSVGAALEDLAAAEYALERLGA